MADLAIVALIFMVFVWYMFVNYAIVIDTSKKGMTFIGLAAKASPDED